MLALSLSCSLSSLLRTLLPPPGLFETRLLELAFYFHFFFKIRDMFEHAQSVENIPRNIRPWRPCAHRPAVAQSRDPASCPGPASPLCCLTPLPLAELSRGGLLEHAGHVPASGAFPLPFAPRAGRVAASLTPVGVCPVSPPRGCLPFGT